MFYPIFTDLLDTNNKEFSFGWSGLILEEDTLTEANNSVFWQYSPQEKRKSKVDRLKELTLGMSFVRLSAQVAFSYITNPFSFAKYFYHFKNITFPATRPRLDHKRLRLSMPVPKAFIFLELKLIKVSGSKLLTSVALLLNHIGIGTIHFKITE